MVYFHLGIIFALINIETKPNEKPMETVKKSLTSEKRMYPRFNVDLPVKYSRTNLFFKQGRTINASEGGLLVSISEKMEIGQYMALKLFFPSRSELKSLETFVQVVWRDIHLRKNWAWDYRTGVKFANISPEDITKLKSFLGGIAKKTPYTA